MHVGRDFTANKNETVMFQTVLMASETGITNGEFKQVPLRRE